MWCNIAIYVWLCTRTDPLLFGGWTGLVSKPIYIYIYMYIYIYICIYIIYTYTCDTSLSLSLSIYIYIYITVYISRLFHQFAKDKLQTPVPNNSTFLDEGWNLENLFTVGLLTPFFRESRGQREQKGSFREYPKAKCVLVEYRGSFRGYPLNYPP